MSDDDWCPKIRKTFRLSVEEFNRLVRTLEKPPRANENLKKLMHRKPPWQHDEPNAETIAALEDVESKEGELFDGITSEMIKGSSDDY